MQYNFQSLEIRSAVLLRQAEFIYHHPGVEFFTIFDFTLIPNGINWIEVRPTSELVGGLDSPLRLAQLRRSENRIQLHAIAINSHSNKVLRILPMWSSSSLLLDGLVRMAERLPLGLEFSAVPSELIQWSSRLLSDDGTTALQVIY